MKRAITSGMFAALLTLGAASPSSAAQTVALRVADSFPASHYMVAALNDWMQRVRDKTGDQVEFTYFGNQQLGKAKDMLSLTQTGATDIAYVAPSYVSEKMPLSAVAELPGGFPDSCTGTLAYWELAKGDGILAQDDLAPNGVRLVFTAVSAPYQILTTQTAIESPDSFAGLKLRAYGPTQELAMRKLDAVPIRMAGPEIRESLARGTLDGIVFPWASLASYDLTPLVAHSTTSQHFGAVPFNYVINEAVWQKLPAEIQVAMAEAGEETTRATCVRIDAETEQLAAQLEQAGIAVVGFDDAAQAELDRTLAGIGPDWALELDGRGKPGSKVLEAFRAAVKSVE